MDRRQSIVDNSRSHARRMLDLWALLLAQHQSALQNYLLPRASLKEGTMQRLCLIKVRSTVPVLLRACAARSEIWFCGVQSVEEGFEDAAEDERGFGVVLDESRWRLGQESVSEAVLRHAVCFSQGRFLKFHDIPPYKRRARDGLRQVSGMPETSLRSNGHASGPTETTQCMDRQ